jgi:hypothetical protein
MLPSDADALDPDGADPRRSTEAVLEPRDQSGEVGDVAGRSQLDRPIALRPARVETPQLRSGTRGQIREPYREVAIGSVDLG